MSLMTFSSELEILGLGGVNGLLVLVPVIWGFGEDLGN